MLEWIIGVITATGIWGIFLLMFVDNVFPPIPSEVIMPLAGYIVTQGKLSFWSIVIAGTAGSAIGSLVPYFAGRLLGEERLKDFADRHGRWLALSRDDIDRAKRWFDRRGGLAVLFCRLIPGIRSLISIPAGISRMNIAAFFVYTTVGSAIWTAFLAYLGVLLGSSFGKVEQYLEPVSWTVLAAIVVLYIRRLIRQGSTEHR